jgi:hypothetical protein
MTRNRPHGHEAPGAEPSQRIWSFRWRDGPEEVACGRNPAAAALALGYGFDDFKDLTWEERR